jgi:hypothetical protein
MALRSGDSWNTAEAGRIHIRLCSRSRRPALGTVLRPVEGRRLCIVIESRSGLYVLERMVEVYARHRVAGIDVISLKSVLECFLAWYGGRHAMDCWWRDIGPVEVMGVVFGAMTRGQIRRSIEVLGVGEKVVDRLAFAFVEKRTGVEGVCRIYCQKSIPTRKNDVHPNGSGAFGSIVKFSTPLAKLPADPGKGGCTRVSRLEVVGDLGGRSEREVESGKPPDPIQVLVILGWLETGWSGQLSVEDSADAIRAWIGVKQRRIR